MNITASGGDATKITEVVPYLISVLWARQNLNCDDIGQLHHMMAGFFGPGVNTAI